MLDINIIRAIACSLPEVVEEPHFDKSSFRIKRKIFLTYDEKLGKATVKLSEIDQDVFSSMAKKIIYPVDNKWGRHGWTTIEVTKISETLLTDVIQTAYCEVAPKKLVEMVKPKGAS